MQSSSYPGGRDAEVRLSDMAISYDIHLEGDCTLIPFHHKYSKEEKEMEKKKKKMKWREIRSTVTMMCVMAAMLSTATFAWFTLTENATVAGLQMTAKSTGGLLVGKASNGDFSNAIEIAASTDLATGNLNANTADNNVLVLRPVTPAANAGEFSLPKYDGGYVTGLQPDAISGTGLKDYVAVYTYYLKAETGTVDVGIVTGNANQSPSPKLNNGIAQATGTFIREENNTTASSTTLNAAAAIRIGLAVADSDDNTPAFYIYEPNADVTATPTAGKIAQVAQGANITAPTSHISSDLTGKITGGSYGTGTGTSTSDKLFSVNADEATLVTMYVWLEGTDAQCGNEIQADLLEGQIQFTIIESNN